MGWKILAVELKQLEQWMFTKVIVWFILQYVGFMYKANLCLRTALKILKPIYQFQAENGVYFMKTLPLRLE